MMAVAPSENLGSIGHLGAEAADHAGPESHLGVDFQQRLAAHADAAAAAQPEEPELWHDAPEHQPEERPVAQEGATPAGTPRPSLGERPEPGTTPAGSPPSSRPPSIGERPMASDADMAPPRDILADPAIGPQLDRYGNATSRAKLARVNDVVQKQYGELRQAEEAGSRNRTFLKVNMGGPSTEQRITAANAGSAINHINDAVDQLRRSVAAARSPEDLDKAISEYGKQSSMIGGSLGKTIMGARTLGVRQRSLRVAGASLGTAVVSGAVAATAIGLTTSHNANQGSGSSSPAAGRSDDAPT